MSLGPVICWDPNLGPASTGGERLGDCVETTCSLLLIPTWNRSQHSVSSSFAGIMTGHTQQVADGILPHGVNAMRGALREVDARGVQVRSAPEEFAPVITELWFLQTTEPAMESAPSKE